MTLRSDIEWLRDAADMMVFGGLPTWPPAWATTTCAEIAANLRSLHRQYLEASMANSGLRARVAELERQIDGERAQNAIMTEQIERIERRTA